MIALNRVQQAEFTSKIHAEPNMPWLEATSTVSTCSLIRDNPIHWSPRPSLQDSTDGTTTGISAADRARTIRAIADSESQPSDFRRPGHVFPLRYREGVYPLHPFAHYL